jgi:hypothetical protein
MNLGVTPESNKSDLILVILSGPKIAGSSFLNTVRKRTQGQYYMKAMP